MPQAGFTPIITYHSTTGAAVPDAANLSPGELALNIADMKLYCENSSGVVTLLASSAGSSGDVVGPASATDDAVVRFNLTTGKLVQNSGVTISDTDVVSGPTQLNVDNLRLDGNTFSSTNTNGNIELTPNGNGRVTTSALSATSPRVITAINDTNGNELFGVTATGSAVNEFTVANAATGNAPTLSATGGDTNIGMALTPKGTGGVIFPAGAVGTPAITTTGDLNTGIYFPAADTIGFVEGGVEAMRIDSSGRVGIGTSSPAAKLDVRTTSFTPTETNAALLLEDPSTWTQACQFYLNNAGSFFSSRPSGGLGAANSGSLWMTGGSLITDNPIGLNGFTASTTAASTYACGGGTHVFYTNSSLTAGNTFTPTERMRIDSSGNVGIGVTSIVSPGASRRGLQISNSTSGGIILLSNDGSESNNPRIFSNVSTQYDLGFAAGSSTGFINWYTNNTERARITSGGYFKASNTGSYRDATSSTNEFISNSSSADVLIVENTSASFGVNVLAVVADRNTTNNSFYAISYYNDGAAAFKFRVADSGNVTNTNNSYGSISDVKLKQDIVDAGSQWDDIKNLRVRKYRWKSEPDSFMQLGLVAQEAEEVSPGLIEEHRDTAKETRTREVEKTREVEVTPAVLDEDGNVVEPAVMETETYTEEEEYTETVDLGTTTKSVKYSVLYMKAVKALQEAMERIETLEAKVAALEND
jgi:hypothetical protein